MPRLVAARVRGEIDRGLRERGSPGRRAPRAGVLDRPVDALREHLVGLVSTAGQMPGRLMRVVQPGADGAVQATALRSGQHPLGGT